MTSIFKTLNQFRFTAMAISFLTACGSSGASDNTKFAGLCLKNDNAGRCECMGKAVRTSIDDNDFHTVAENLKVGDFGVSGSELQSNIENLVGSKHHYLLSKNLGQGCVTTYLSGGPGVSNMNKMFDEDGRHTDGAHKGKRDYEAYPNAS